MTILRMVQVQLVLSAAILPLAASRAAAADWDTPLTRMRPIDPPPQAAQRAPVSSSAGHRRVAVATAGGAATPPAAANAFRTAGDDGFQPAAAVRQAARMQANAAPFAMPSEGPSVQAVPPTSLPVPLSSSPPAGPIAPSPGHSSDPLLPRPTLGTGNLSGSAPQTYAAPAPTTAPATAVPGSLSPVPRDAFPPQSPPANTDYAPLAQPRLENHFATLSNCRNVSAPSGYRSDRILTCGPVATMVTTAGASAPPPVYLPPPAQVGPPVVGPPATAPGAPFAPGQIIIPGPAGYRPLISFGQERYPVQVGQGIFGQPTAYVPGQTFRNAIRYITW